MKIVSPSLEFIPSNPAELRHAVTHMAAYINVADWQFLKLIAEMDRTQSWRINGYCNLPNWLDHQCGMGPCAARERIRIGRALESLPNIDEAFKDGVLSYSKVRAITRVANAETDLMLLEIAERSSAGELDRLVKTYERVSPGKDKKQPAYNMRTLEWYYEDGMLIINARVPAEQGALVIKALEKVIDLKKEEREKYWEALYKNGHGCVDHSLVDSVHDKSANHAAAGEEVKLQDNAGQGENVSAESFSDECLTDSLLFEMSSREQKFADAMVEIAEHYLATEKSGIKQRSSGHRYEVVLHIDRNQLAAAQQKRHEDDDCSDDFDEGSYEESYEDPYEDSSGGSYEDSYEDNHRGNLKNHHKDDHKDNHKSNHKSDDPARYYVDPGWGIDEEAARQIACDADVTELIQNERGDILNYERRSRIVPARLMRALMIRDEKCCRFPGCSHSKYLEAHHVHHWIDGGETRLENLAMLCSAHHRLLHHRQFHMEIWDDQVVFIGKHGELLEETLYPQFPDVSAETLNTGTGEALDAPADTTATHTIPTHKLPTHTIPTHTTPTINASARQFAAAKRAKQSSLFRDHTERELVDMIHFREEWGNRRDERIWKQIVGSNLPG